jgi:hypothetical protein
MRILASVLAFVLAVTCQLGTRQSPSGRGSQTRDNPAETEVWSPSPPVVTPGATDAAPPSDAIVLFAGSNVKAWVASKDKSPARWKVENGC